MPIVSGWLRLVSSGRVADGPILLTGVYVNGSVSGATVTLYNALDVIASSKILDVIVGGTETKSVLFQNAVYCERGLYVTLDANVDECMIAWLPIREG